MKKIQTKTAIAIVLSGISLNIQAALTTGAVLEFVPSEMGCAVGGTYPNCDFDLSEVTGGSYLAMDFNADGTFDIGDRKPLTMSGGIRIGSLQGPGEIDQWTLWGSNGYHTTGIPVTVVDNDVNGDGGFTKTLDFSGWGFTWNSNPITNAGGDPANYPGETGLATITCSQASCSASSTFVLDYMGHVPTDDPTIWAGTNYALRLEGTVGSVPVPAAAWLFGSGLLGLVGMARNKACAPVSSGGNTCATG